MAEKGIEVARTIVESLEKVKGEDILLLDIEEICSFTDYFVICTGSSRRMIKALADEVMKQVKEKHVIRAQNIEGQASDGWVLIDYGDVVLHLFSHDLRGYYQLEELWKGGQVLVRVQ
jgi:ribosome-associated protein